MAEMNLGFVIVSPFVLLLLGALVLRKPLWQSALAAFVAGLVLWGFVPEAVLFSPLMRAFILACEVGLILLGAIAFLEYMEAIGTTDRIKTSLAHFSSGKASVEALLLAWLFCGFLEGAAGFGAPAALIAPLLASLGFPPLLAAVLPLVGDSAAVPFGAAGTPVRIGLAGLPMETAGIYAAGINILAGLVAPLAIIHLVHRQSPEEGRPLGLALWAGLCFTLPAFAVSFLGPEFPSLAGSLIGLLVFSTTLLVRQKEKKAISGGRAIASLSASFSPYLLVCGGLLLGKLALGELKLVVGSQAVSAFQPGLVFLLVMAFLFLWRRDKSLSQMKSYLVVAARRLPLVWAAIFCLAGLAQLVVQNTAGRMDGWSPGPGAAVLLLIGAPVAGALGAFVAGSATVACLLTGPFLAQSAELLGLNVGLVLGLQLVGAGAGNMISLQNLAAVQVTVGLVDQEAEMLRHLWWPCAAYVIVSIIVGLALHLFT